MNNMATAIFDSRESTARSYCRHFDVVFGSGRGSLLFSENGDEYIDFLSGCSALNYGHNDPDMKEALLRHISDDRLAHALDLFTPEKRVFLKMFEDVILKPRNLDYRVQFTGPTGANAVEAALKLARKVTGRTNVISFSNGYHGVTMGALAATGNGYNRAGAGMPLHGVSRAFFDGYFGPDVDTADMLERMLDDASSGIDPPAAILLETIQGEGGLNVASLLWLRRIAQLAQRHKALLIVDDIQAGCGRAGTFFSFDGTGIVPDLITLSKSLSGFGLPMSVVLIRPDLDQWGPGEHNGTFRGNTHAFVTARIALEKFWSDPRFEAEIAQSGRIIAERLTAMARHIPGAAVKGRGMMQGIDVGSGELASRICRECFANGLIIETSGPRSEVVKILAPLNTPTDLLQRGLDVLQAAVEKIVRPDRAAAE